MNIVNLKDENVIKTYLNLFNKNVETILNKICIVPWYRFHSHNCWYTERIVYETSVLVFIKSYETVVAIHNITDGRLFIKAKYSSSTTRQINRYIKETTSYLTEVVNINGHLLGEKY